MLSNKRDCAEFSLVFNIRVELILHLTACVFLFLNKNTIRTYRICGFFLYCPYRVNGLS